MADELKGIGAEKVSPGHRGVGFFGDRRILWRANIESRIANRILVPVAEFPAQNRDELYDGVARVKWNRWFEVEQTIAVDASSHKSAFQHTGFIAQVAKDGICDVFRKMTGQRPSVHKTKPDVRINIRLDWDRCLVSLDSSGERLHRRGYRLSAGDAPLKETLAAGILRRLGYHRGVTLYDPLCGSGTFLIEAALMASQTPPGLMRIGESGFGFMRWLTHKSDAFHGYVRELEAGIKPLENHRFYGSDSDGKMVGIALRNIAKAGFDGLIDLKRGFAEELQPERPLRDRTDWLFAILHMESGWANKRLLKPFSGLGRDFSATLSRYALWYFVGEGTPIRGIGLKSNRRTAMRNGGLQCHLVEYEIFGRRSDSTEAD